jgi:hypothetical protein
MADTHDTHAAGGDTPYRGSTPNHAPFALVGYVDSPAELFHGCEALRDAGYKHFDAHTPFPVHGLERAMGLPPSKLPWIVLTAAFLGLSGAVALAWYTQVVAYPHTIGGKEPFSWQAFMPIFFECTVLFSAFGCFFGLWALNKQPEYFHPVMQHPTFHRATDDKFFISVEARDPKFDRDATRQMLVKLGFQQVEEVMP